ncbi:TDT family transporter [Clostridioides sp. ZZV15-6597]|uniref:TDT family transporter n=1 Tax=Clostridioides sp. ZZV15-6597 TaxID=2811500 RepID=UPI001D129116|nr:TDT family transporter [Clostridioides sp. ZZV15-6597]
MNLLKKYPIPIASLILSIFALGNLLQSYSESLHNVIGFIGFTLYAIYIVKIILLRKSVKEQLENPLVLSTFPTITMATMIFAIYVKPLSPELGIVIWGIGIVGHMVLVVLFSKKFLVNFSIKTVFPSWYIVYVGVVTASVTAPVFNQLLIGKIAFWIGFISYIVLIPIVLKRVWIIKEMPEPSLPTLAILAAPGSLLLSGYINSFSNKNSVILYLLFVSSIVFYIVVLGYLPKLLRLPFYPSFAAFTFPMAISETSIKLMNGYLVKSGSSVSWIAYASKLEEIIATIMVLYVLILFLVLDNQEDEGLICEPFLLW